jgi:hypothetical protein
LKGIVIVIQAEGRVVTCHRAKNARPFGSTIYWRSCQGLRAQHAMVSAFIKEFAMSHSIRIMPDASENVAADELELKHLNAALVTIPRPKCRKIPVSLAHNARNDIQRNKS